MPKVEQADLLDTQPVSQVVCICQCSRQTYKSDPLAQLGTNIIHTRYNDFQDGTAIAAKQVNLVNNNQRHLLDIGTSLPITTDTIPLLRSRDDDVGALNGFDIRSNVSCQLDQLLVHRTDQTTCPIRDTLSNQSLHGRDIDDLAPWLIFECPPHRQFGSNSLS